MNKYFKDLLRTTSIHAIALTFVVWTFTVFATVTFPGSTPDWETPGGSFMSYFSKILVDSNIITTDWTVKKADTTDWFHLDQNILTTSTPTFSAVRAANSFISTGTSGWYNETHGWWFYMSDSTRVRVTGDKNIYTAGSVRADNNIETLKVCLSGDCRTSWPKTEDFSVAKNIIKKYHTWCNDIDDTFQCIAACRRYCSGWCSASIWSCNGDQPWKWFVSGLSVEMDSTNIVCSCLK